MTASRSLVALSSRRTSLSASARTSRWIPSLSICRWSASASSLVSSWMIRFMSFVFDPSLSRTILRSSCMASSSMSRRSRFFTSSRNPSAWSSRFTSCSISISTSLAMPSRSVFCLKSSLSRWSSWVTSSFSFSRGGGVSSFTFTSPSCSVVALALVVAAEASAAVVVTTSTPSTSSSEASSMVPQRSRSTRSSSPGQGFPSNMGSWRITRRRTRILPPLPPPPPPLPLLSKPPASSSSELAPHGDHSPHSATQSTGQGV
mmetsp:Transcript_39114/g.75070  ORF Transcript_39114/g.75070 Transcript_39114/m.75070 type:complete len:260 (-) Transcript_39114:395-1174(-)